jgi:hypothetical protein
MTIAELKEISASSGIAHARFCLEQEASQVGREALDDVFAALCEMEQDEFAADDTE